MSGEMKGKVALVTEAGSAVGQATALAFAREGARVAVTDRSEERGRRTAELGKGAGYEFLFVPADTSRPDQVESLICQTVDAYGALDCAVNNASFGGDLASFAECPEELWDGVVDSNLKGTWLCMNYETREMLHRGGGSIVNVSWGSELIGIPSYAPYVAANYGVIGLTKSIAARCAADNIRLNVVCPGYIDTGLLEELRRATASSEMIEIGLALVPMRRIGRPEEVARVALWLCSHNSSYITGQAVMVDGGRMVR
ncbi:MAG: SDR family oxidoreductase [Acidobacteriota bacterium]